MRNVFPYKLGSPAGYRAQLGLIALQTDETLEYDLRRILPNDGVALYTSRVPMAPDVSPQSLASMAEALPTAAGLLPPDIDFKAVAYGCTSGTAVIGANKVNQLIASNCSSSAVTDPVTALTAACQHLGVAKLAFLSPYVEEVSVTLRDTLAEQGIDSPHFGSFNEALDTKVARIDKASIVDAAVNLYQRGGCDAVFISCTSLQTLDIIPQIEKICHGPVLSSNLVLGWHMMTLAGIKNEAFGSFRLCA